jgi:hypothetical protein
MNLQNSEKKVGRSPDKVLRVNLSVKFYNKATQTPLTSFMIKEELTHFLTLVTDKYVTFNVLLEKERSKKLLAYPEQYFRLESEVIQPLEVIIKTLNDKSFRFSPLLQISESLRKQADQCYYFLMECRHFQKQKEMPAAIQHHADFDEAFKQILTDLSLKFNKSLNFKYASCGKLSSTVKHMLLINFDKNEAK